MKVAVVGGGWAGLSAAIAARQQGHHVTLLEASRHWGGRARTLAATLPGGESVALDNGQHILIGAYTETLRLMQLVGIQPSQVLHRTPLNLRQPDGSGIALPPWPTPLDAIAGIVQARGWSWRDKWSLVRASMRWQRQKFQCAASLTVQELCASLTPTVMRTLIDPLCVSALNTPSVVASAQVFLTVLKDSLFGVQGGSNLLLPTASLGELFPSAAIAWLQAEGVQVRSGQRITELHRRGQWLLHGEAFDAVIWATHPSVAAQVMGHCTTDLGPQDTQALQAWAECAGQLQHEAIATVYAWAPQATLQQAMLALPEAMPSGSATPCPAQFVFDRGQLGGPAGLLAFVVSASQGDAHTLEQQVTVQAQQQLGLHVTPMQTVVEKRATFACTSGLHRPAQQIAPGLMACGDYVDGPYPATLEGAVRSGWSAGISLGKVNAAL